MDSEFASLLNKLAGRPQQLAMPRLPPRRPGPQVLAIPASDPVGVAFSATSYEKDIANFRPGVFPSLDQNCRTTWTSDGENEYTLLEEMIELSFGL